jgi:hypothetical protein
MVSVDIYSLLIEVCIAIITQLTLTTAPSMENNFKKAAKPTLLSVLGISLH